MDKFLQRGDRIRLEKGMKVCAPIPRRFLTREDNPITEEIDYVVIKIGQVFKRKFLISQDVIQQILSHYGFEVDDEKREKVEVSILFNTGKFEGEYTVTQVLNSEHSVYCEKNDASKITLKFNQAGDFTMIPPGEIIPLNRD